MVIGELTCGRDGVATQLTCVGCGAPICPACLVRTPVGLKCSTCTGSATKARGRAVPALAMLAVALVPVIVWLVFSPGSRSGSDSRAGDAAATLDLVNTAAQSRMGDEVRSGPFAFTVNQVECVGREVGTPPDTRTAQGRFCLVHLKVRNAGDGPESYVGATQLVADSSARRYSPGVMESGPPPPALVMASGDKEITTVRLNPGSEVSGVLVFDMPVTAKPAEFEFRPGPAAMGAKVRLDAMAP